jgi:hypothetical protein
MFGGRKFLVWWGGGEEEGEEFNSSSLFINWTNLREREYQQIHRQMDLLKE